jgi:hypothetical protein
MRDCESGGCIEDNANNIGRCIVDNANNIGRCIADINADNAAYNNKYVLLLIVVNVGHRASRGYKKDK